MSEDEDWLEFNGTIRNVGNKGKSRGINVSKITQPTDIGRNIVGRFRFTDQAPDTSELTKERKELIILRRADKIHHIKVNCCGNQLIKFSKETGIDVELLLTEINHDIYLELWKEFTKIEINISKIQRTDKTKNDIKIQEKLLKEQIVNKLKVKYNQIPPIIIKAVEDDVLLGYTQSFIDKFVEQSENYMTDRTLVWKRKKKKKSSEKK